MNTSHPNRLNKQRGDKLSSWSHSCQPTTLRQKIEVDQQFDDSSKPTKKSKKNKHYEIYVKWQRYFEGIALQWWKGGKYLKLVDAEKAFDKFKDEYLPATDKDGNSLRHYHYSDIKLTYKDKIIKEFNRNLI